MNNTILVGKVYQKPFKEELEGKSVVRLIVAVNRNFKNAEGEYETDYINTILWNAIADTAVEYLEKGDTIGIKGRLQSEVMEDKEGYKKFETYLVAEKITFLSTKKPEEK